MELLINDCIFCDRIGKNMMTNASDMLCFELPFEYEYEYEYESKRV